MQIRVPIDRNDVISLLTHRKRVKIPEFTWNERKPIKTGENTKLTHGTTCDHAVSIEGAPWGRRAVVCAKHLAQNRRLHSSETQCADMLPKTS
jgi:hypothetical protein